MPDWLVSSRGGFKELHPLRLPEGFERIPQVAKIGLGDSPKLSRVTEEDLRDVAPSD